MAKDSASDDGEVGGARADSQEYVFHKQPSGYGIATVCGHTAALNGLKAEWVFGLCDSEDDVQCDLS